ncbi:hypothetical protein BaRGS_00004864, partial [Batillaria attramentaria]
FQGKGRYVFATGAKRRAGRLCGRNNFLMLLDRLSLHYNSGRSVRGETQSRCKSDCTPIKRLTGSHLDNSSPIPVFLNANINDCTLKRP